MSSRPGSTPDGRPLTAALLYGGAAAGVIALHLSTNSTLGFHTDELYTSPAAAILLTRLPLACLHRQPSRQQRWWPLTYLIEFAVYLQAWSKRLPPPCVSSRNRSRRSGESFATSPELAGGSHRLSFEGGATVTAWKSDELVQIGAAEEVQIASLRRDGTLRKTGHRVGRPLRRRAVHSIRRGAEWPLVPEYPGEARGSDTSRRSSA